ncbi:MAG: aminotransferase class IV [Flavitalea sp.]
MHLHNQESIPHLLRDFLCLPATLSLRTSGLLLNIVGPLEKMNNLVNFNGKFFRAEEPLIGAESRALRYGDGVFETIRMLNGHAEHAELHYNRLFEGLNILGFELPQLFTRDYLTEQILKTATKNKVEQGARIRLALFRGNGGLYDPENHRPNFIVQAWPLPAQNGTLNLNGLVTGIYTKAVKCYDAFSHLKTASHLTYVMAALYAKEMKWNDALVLNTSGRICDTSIANIFIVKGKKIITPPLSEGCVAGIMRRYILREIAGTGFEGVEQPITTEDLLDADECFITNAI